MYSGPERRDVLVGKEETARVNRNVQEACIRLHLYAGKTTYTLATTIDPS